MRGVKGVKTNEGKGKNIGVKNEDTIIPILGGMGIMYFIGWTPFGMCHRSISRRRYLFVKVYHQ